MREGTTSFERADAVCVDDAFSSSSSSGGGFGRDGRKSFRDVVSELSTGEKVAFALAALPALPLILCFTPLLAVHVCVSKLEGVDRDDAPPPPRRVENTGVYASAGTSPSPSIPAMGFALDPTVRMSLDDSFRSGNRRRHPRPVPRPKRGSTPSREANAMWERNLADGSASDANSSVDGSARGGGGDSAFGWSPRSSPLASPSQSRGGSTHAGAEIPRAGILKRRATSLDVVSHAADEWNAATPSPSPSPSPPRSSDESSPRSSSSSSVDEHEREHELERERERARVSDRRVRFGSETSVAEVLIDAPSNVRSNVRSYVNANAYPTSKARASRTSPRRASPDGTASLVMGTYRQGKRSGMDAYANSWRVGSTLHARVSMDGARAEDRPRRRLRFSAA